jgi:hypothetical protein
MSKRTGLAVTMFLGVGGILVSSWTHASRARHGVPAAEEAGLRTGVQTEDSPTFDVLGFRFNRLWIPFWPCSPREVLKWSSCALPKNLTLDDLEVFTRAMACHDPLPPGFPAPSHETSDFACTTGAVDWMGRHEIQLRHTNGVGRLASAKLYLDGDLVSEASLDDGTIVDRGDESEATLHFFLPWLPNFTVTLITDDPDGQMEESSFSIGHSSLSSR